MNHLLLTGVPGWLTTAFLESLRNEPMPGLQAITCLADARAPAPSIAGIPGVGIRVCQGRVEDPASLAAAVNGCDAVLHTAGLVHVSRTRDWYEVNTQGTKNLLAAAVAAGSIRRFVFVSSNAAAGRSPVKEHVMTERDPPQPLSHYGKSKLLAEEAIRDHASHFETVVLRPCMFYGPPVPARHVDVYRRLLTGRMPLVGHGEYARSLTYIDHLVQACRLALSHPQARGETFFIADAVPYTTRSIVEAMAAALGTLPRFVRIPAWTAPLAYQLDCALAKGGLYAQNLHLVGEADWHVGVSIEKAVRLLGYAPRVDLHEGMRRAIRWCRQHQLLPG